MYRDTVLSTCTDIKCTANVFSFLDSLSQLGKHWYFACQFCNISTNKYFYYNFADPKVLIALAMLRLVLSVRPSVRLSVVCPHKSQAISRFTGLSDC